MCLGKDSFPPKPKILKPKPPPYNHTNTRTNLRVPSTVDEKTNAITNGDNNNQIMATILLVISTPFYESNSSCRYNADNKTLVSIVTIMIVPRQEEE